MSITFTLHNIITWRPTVKELDEVYSSVLLKKYKKSRKVWCNYCSSLATQQRLDEMRDLLTKALKSLPKDKRACWLSWDKCFMRQLYWLANFGNRILMLSKSSVFLSLTSIPCPTWRLPLTWTPSLNQCGPWTVIYFLNRLHRFSVATFKLLNPYTFSLFRYQDDLSLRTDRIQARRS